MDIDDLQSQTIDFLRFPLIVGVVLIHAYGGCLIVRGVELGTNFSFPVNDYFQNFFSQVIGRLSVPMFFVISGYLFFYHVKWSKRTYLYKLKKRFHTLFLPYMFWNGMAVLFSYIITLPLFKSLFPGAFANGFHYSWFRLLQDFWNVPTYSLPIAGQFWFIRDLIMLIVLSPVIFELIKRTHYIGFLYLVLFGIIWYYLVY